MPAEPEVPICVRCGLEVRVCRETYEVLERMHYVCFHYAFEHIGFDPDQECVAPDCPSSRLTSARRNGPAPGETRVDHSDVALPREPATSTLPTADDPPY